MLPDLEDLSCFLEAARRLNFRAAAAALGLTPSALGQRIRALEDQVGRPLFLRTTRKVELTAAGFALLPQATLALEQADRCLRAARGDLDPPPMNLRLGTRHELGLSWLLPVLPELEATFPSITFHLYFGSGPDLELRLLGREIDCAQSSRRIADPRLVWEALHQEDYVFVGAPSLLGERPLTAFEHASRHTLIDTSPDQPLFAYWREAAGEGLPFADLRTMGTIAAIHALVLRGKGVGVLPRYLVGQDLQDGRLVPVLPQVEARSDRFRLVYRAGDPRSAVFRLIAQRMVEFPLR